jgi:hypothetical protein
LSFLFGQISVIAIWLCQNKSWIGYCCLKNKNIKTKITSRLQFFSSYLQYTNNVGKKYYEEKNGSNLEWFEQPKINIKEAMTFHNAE